MPSTGRSDPESLRLLEDGQRDKNWKRWGPYLSERQWATVREDYSSDGNCWDYFPHDQARSRAYRWGEDGLLGICDRECRLCFALALWNGKDPILKERLFGLTGPQGNHGEDVKEVYFYLDSTPTHSYFKALYKYPQREFPYQWLVEENGRRSKQQPEFELADTGVFDEERYWDVTAEYAKASPDDILIRLTLANRGPEAAEIHLLPTLWYRNAWAWGCTHEGCSLKPPMNKVSDTAVIADHPTLGKFRLEAEAVGGTPAPWLFTDNETDNEKAFGVPNTVRFVKDAFHQFVVDGNADAINPKSYGTKAAPHYRFTVPAGQEVVVRLRLFPDPAAPQEAFGPAFDQIFKSRIAEADQFYAVHTPGSLDPEQSRVMRQAYAGLMWSKQFYHYVVKDWLDGDPHQPAPPPERKKGRNAQWRHVFSRDILSMPDKWEYPWFASWDLAFHMIPIAHIDPKFAQDQLLLILREWYMHANGQLPAYEFSFDDVNPPVHAWACWRVYKIAAHRNPDGPDRLFLERAFQKLMINFTWWVNRKDAEGHNIFAGGFLGLDNIGIFDRSRPLPGGARLNQADGTAWMAFFCATMLSMALELASGDPAYEDVASKFFEHFVAITDAINTLGGTGLWDEGDGFYYDWLQTTDGASIPLRLRSMVGIIPLFTCEILREDVLQRLPGFCKRMNWFLKHRPDLGRFISYLPPHDKEPGRYLLAVPSKRKLLGVLKYALSEAEFLSPHGIRSLSKVYKDNPFRFTLEGQEHTAQYTAAESNTSLFGGNSNWRGPVWFPLNFLFAEALQRYHHFWGDTVKVEHPTGSGKMLNLAEVAEDIEMRLTGLFLPDGSGRRPCNGDNKLFEREHWKGLINFHEYFDGDTGRGVGASHQTGWTGLVARILRDIGRRRSNERGMADRDGHGVECHPPMPGASDTSPPTASGAPPANGSPIETATSPVSTKKPMTAGTS